MKVYIASYCTAADLEAAYDEKVSDLVDAEIWSTPQLGWIAVCPPGDISAPLLSMEPSGNWFTKARAEVESDVEELYSDDDPPLLLPTKTWELFASGPRHGAEGDFYWSYAYYRTPDGQPQGEPDAWMTVITKTVEED